MTERSEYKKNSERSEGIVSFKFLNPQFNFAKTAPQPSKARLKRPSFSEGIGLFSCLIRLLYIF